MRDWIMIAFADGTVVGQHPGITRLAQGFSYVDASSPDVQDCVGKRFVRDYGEVETGHGSYLITATLHCLGLGVRPGGTVALLRVDDIDGQAAQVYHQTSDDAPAPPDARATAVVPEWQGTGWAEPPRVRDHPDDAPPTDWPINATLRTLGVTRDGHPDETTALGLVLPPPD